MNSWSNLAKVVYKRTYARNDNGITENWKDTVERVIRGNVKNHNVSKNEIEALWKLFSERKAMPAGRGIWYSGSPSHERLGGVALNNCWFTTADDYENFVLAQDLLMLGGGVGMSIEHRFVSKLSKIKRDVSIILRNSNDADFIIPDSREGWNEMTRRVLESFFKTGKSFSYSTVCIRGAGESIKGFGGKASGPQPFVTFIEKVSNIFKEREGKHLRPIDAMDILCSIGEFVVAGNVRRSAIIILGDAWDKEYLRSKRWDLGPIPTQRAMANLSVVCDDIEDLHPLFWKTYEAGEPFGIVNRKNIQKYGRMGELKKDTAVGVNPCVTGDTEILTKDGYKRIDSLVGQTIEVWNGFEWSSVTPKITGVDQKILKITFSDGRELSCTPYHKFHLSSDYKGKVQVVEAKDLSAGDKLIKNEFPVIEHGLDCANAYTQGFVAAEGMELSKTLYVYKPKEEVLSRLTYTNCKWSEGNKRYQLTLSEVPWSKSFVPFDYNLKSKLDWLAGLFDGDGCELREGGLQLASVNRKFLHDLQKLLSTIGIQSKVTSANEAGLRSMPNHKDGTSEYYCQESFRILVGAVQLQELKRLGLRCERLKFNKNPQRDASQFVKVVSVEECGVADRVFCFTEHKRNLALFNGIITGQCAEAALEDGEPCNLQEIFLPNLKSVEEFEQAAKLMHRWGKRVTCEKYHNEKNNEVVKRNRRIGTGITGCLQAPNLFKPEVLDRVYNAIQEENRDYSKALNIAESIRTTVVKPSGTLSLIGDCTPGIHPSYSKYYIRRVRFSANDKLIPVLKKAGHYMEPVVKFDGTLDHNTLVVDFYVNTPDNTPCADEGFDTWKQLDTLLLAQKHWADQAVSVTVYYKKEEIEQIKNWLADNLKNIKTISFLCYNNHGFKQAPLEKTTKDLFDKYNETVTSISFEDIETGELDSFECEGGVCPIK